MITSSRLKYFLTLLSFTCITLSSSLNAALKKPVKNLFNSPSKVEKPIINYCKKIITALNNDDLDEFKQLWLDFFSKIRYPIKIHDKRFYLAASYCLANCLAVNSNENMQIHLNLTNDLIYIAIQADKHNYIIQFHVTDNTEAEPTALRTYQNAEDKTEKYEIIGIEINSDTTSCISLPNNGPLVAKAPAISLQYQEDNFIKKMMLSGLITHEMKPFIQALSTIYNKIPHEWHIKREKFYQSLLAWILIFMGNALTMPEETTGYGRTDITTVNPEHINIIEYKLNRSAHAAFAQIEKRAYAKTIHSSDKTTTMIGVNVNTKKIPFVVTAECKTYSPSDASPFLSKKTTKHTQSTATQEAIDISIDPFGTDNQ